VVYQNILNNYQGSQTALDRLKYGYSLQFSGGANQFAAQFKFDRAPELPDLVSSSISLTKESWQPGDYISAWLTVKNNGPGNAGGHYSQLRLSSDMSINTSDTALGAPIYYNSVAAGDTQMNKRSFIVPELSNGTYYMAAIIDSNNRSEKAMKTIILVFVMAPYQLLIPGNLYYRSIQTIETYRMLLAAPLLLCETPALAA
jgi:CARDB.